MDVVVIGSGMAGLTAAALLAQSGHSVTLYEHNERIGGVTAPLVKDGFRWDLGQMLLPDLGPGEPGWNVLAKLGIADNIETVRAYRNYSFPDFAIRRPTEYRGIYWRREYLKTLFPDDAQGLDEYYRLYDRIHDLAGLGNRKGLFAKLRLLLKFLPISSRKNWSARKLMDHLFSDKKLKAVFTTILADYVCRPCDFPGLILPIINAEAEHDERIPLDYGTHQHRSSWRLVVGGCSRIVDALSEVIRKNRGTILTGQTVIRINTENGQVRGVVLADGSLKKCDAVIASGGAKELFLDLVGQENLPPEFVTGHVENVFTTESVFMVHLGVDFNPAAAQDGAAVCYYYLTYDVEKGVEECLNGIYHEGNDGFVVFIPSLYSHQMAPAGHHSISIYTIAPNRLREGSWEEKKQAWAEKLLDLAERYIKGLREHEKARVIVTPEDFKKWTHLDRHAFGGAVPRLDRSPPPHRTPIRGLMFAGAQSQTFGGVVNAITGADQAVRLLLKDFK
jgi:prolycopene isomerase